MGTVKLGETFFLVSSKYFLSFLQNDKWLRLTVGKVQHPKNILDASTNPAPARRETQGGGLLGAAWGCALSPAGLAGPDDGQASTH